MIKFITNLVRHTLVVAGIISFIASCFFTITTIITASENLQPYIATFGIALLSILVIVGGIKPDHAKDGVTSVIYSTLPKIYHWGAVSFFRTFVTAIIAFSLSFLIIWLGPHSLITFSIACDDARYIKMKEKGKLIDCRGALSVPVWSPPILRSNNLSFFCLDIDKNEWQGSTQTPTSGTCGLRPTNSLFVSNGILPLQIDKNTVEGKRTHEGVERLREALSNGNIPDRRLSDRLMIATWNINRNGDRKDLWGEYLQESYAYIAEVISYFDITAIQGISSQRSELKLIMNHLGNNYKFHREFGTLSPMGPYGSDCFIYDSRKVEIGNLSASLDMPHVNHYITDPFLTEFIVNNRSFFMVSTTVNNARDNSLEQQNRIDEFEDAAWYLNMVGRYSSTNSLILTGSLGSLKFDGPELTAFRKSEFMYNNTITSLTTNPSHPKSSGQILMLKTEETPMSLGRVGVFPIFDYVFRDNDWEVYSMDLTEVPKNKNMTVSIEELQNQYRQKMRYFQISDDLLKWAELRIKNEDN